MKEAVGYVRQRRQFGAALSEFQGIQFMLADMEIALEASRLLLDQAASAFGGDIQTMMKTASVAKVYCSEAAVKAAETAVQIFGGYGARIIRWSATTATRSRSPSSRARARCSARSSRNRC